MGGSHDVTEQSHLIAWLRDTISKLAKKVQTHGILIDRKPLKRNRVLTEETLDISHRLENSHRKPLRRLARQSGVSVGSAWVATKLLHIRPYKIVLPEIKPVDCEKSVRFCYLSVMCMTDFLILNWHFSQMRLILISRVILTHITTGIGVVKILMP
jgi:hypothetical protein